MSEDTFKAGFIGRLPHLTGKSEEEVMDFFHDHIGPPDKYEYYQGPIRPIHDSEGWAVSFWTNQEPGGMFVLSAPMFSTVCQWIEDHFGVRNGDIQVVAYSYYNGSDDPVDVGKLQYAPTNHSGEVLDWVYDLRKWPQELPGVDR